MSTPTVRVTIDGPAGSGKSTTARGVAERLGYQYIDSGALYRAIAWRARENGVDPSDVEELGRLAAQSDLNLEFSGGRQRVWIDGTEVTDEIRQPEISEMASRIAREPGVRDALTRVQRGLAARGGVVLEGRDSGTVVLPAAEVKIYLTASVHTRAERRQKELALAGVEIPVEEVERDLEARDAQDSSREHSPLCKPEGALEVDTTGLSIAEQIDAVVRAVRTAAATWRLIPLRERLRRGIRDMRPVYRVSWCLLNMLGTLLVGFRVLVRGEAHFEGGCIVACNHVSFWDPPIVGSAILRETRFLAKKQLFRNWFFGWLISAYNAVPIDRDRIDREGLKMAQNLLRSGRLLLIFPEGTRQKSGLLGKPLPGMGALAIGAGVPVVPAFVSGTRSFWKNFFRRGRLCVCFGEPVDPGSVSLAEGRSRAARELTTRVMDEIRDLESSVLRAS
jgi:cytidylate kinase